MSSTLSSAARRGKSLPALIASFPGNPDGLLVRRTLWPSEAFVRVTRANLKFRDRAAVLAKSQKPGPSSRAMRTGVGLKVGTKLGAADPNMDETTSADDLTVGELWPSGRVYGMEFFASRWKRPQSSRASPDQEIRGGIKHEWEVISPSELSRTARDNIDAAYAERTRMLREQTAGAARSAEANIESRIEA